MSVQLRLNQVSVEFPIFGGIFGRRVGEVKAVSDVSFEVHQGETVGLVGESGCGKSTLGKAIVRLIRTSNGSIHFENQDLARLSRSDLQNTRRRLQMVFQDPYSSLNPRMRVKSILAEPLNIHRLGAPRDRSKKVEELLELVGLRPESADKYPHEFSGGQRQRIGIARALAVKPSLIVADEPVSALDVSIQSQILNLLRTLQDDFKLTYLFISHNLNVVSYLCDRVVVMYLGRIMEILTHQQLVDPSYKKHPYTEALIAAAPKKHPNLKHSISPLEGDIPSPAHPPTGCVFHTRCPEAENRCRIEVPRLQSQTQSHEVACHRR